MVGAELAEEKLGELMTRLAPCFTRREPRLQTARYVRALMSGLPRKNGWTIAAEAGDRAPDKTQRLLSHASWDTLAAMREIGGFVTAYLDEAAGPGTLRVFALDETGQQKKGTRTADVKRQHMGCTDGVANGINTVHVSYATPAGHALIGAREWIPEKQIADPRCRQGTRTDGPDGGEERAAVVAAGQGGEDLNGDPDRTVPYAVSLSVPGPDAEVAMLAVKDLIAISNGSARVAAWWISDR